MRPAASTRLFTNRLLVPVAERDGIRIGWAEQGDGVPLVLITGVGGAGSAWWRLLRHLPPTVRAITLDNRGTGASDPVAGRFFGLDDLAGDVVAVMDPARTSWAPRSAGSSPSTSRWSIAIAWPR